MLKKTWGIAVFWGDYKDSCRGFQDFLRFLAH